MSDTNDIQIGDSVVADPDPDLVELTAKAYTVNEKMRHMIANAAPGLVVGFAGDGLEVAYGGSVWRWSRKSMRLWLRPGDKARVRLGVLPSSILDRVYRNEIQLFGLGTSSFWEKVDGVEVRAWDLYQHCAFTCADVEDPKFRACARRVTPMTWTAKEWTKLTGVEKVALPLAILEPARGPARAEPKGDRLDEVLAGLFDSVRDKRDCGGLLAEYRQLTGRDKPGFML